VKPKKTLKPEDVIAIIDTREQSPLCLDPLKTISKGLSTGDYSVCGLESRISIERKSLNDFVQCCTYSRERFERELVRMREYEFRAIVDESTWDAIQLKHYHGATHPNAVLGSAMAFAMMANVPIIMAGSHANAGKLVSRLLWVSANRCFREGAKLCNDADIIAQTSESA